jgi:hypothetical protein
MRDSFVFLGTTQSACTERAFGRHKTLTTRRQLNDAFVPFLDALQIYAGPSPFRRGKDGIPCDQCDKGRFHSGGGVSSLPCARNRRQCMSALRSAECGVRNATTASGWANRLRSAGAGTKGTFTVCRAVYHEGLCSPATCAREFILASVHQ